MRVKPLEKLLNQPWQSHRYCLSFASAPTQPTISRCHCEAAWVRVKPLEKLLNQPWQSHRYYLSFASVPTKPTISCCHCEAAWMGVNCFVPRNAARLLEKLLNQPWQSHRYYLSFAIYHSTYNLLLSLRGGVDAS